MHEVEVLNILCVVCSCVWHRSCYEKRVKKTDCERLPMVSVFEKLLTKIIEYLKGSVVIIFI